MGKRTSRTRGFTLLEMLVAMSLICVLAGSLYASLHIAFKARNSAARAIDATRTMELALNLLEQDLRCAAIPKGVLASTFVGQDGKDAFGNDADSLVFCCTAATLAPLSDEAAGQVAGDMRKVELLCEPSGGSDEQVLLRLVTTNLLAPVEVEPREEVVCRSVRAFNLRYFDGTEWQESWDAGAYENALPLAVEITVEVNTDRPTRQGTGYRVSRVLLIPCGSSTSDSSMAVPGQ